MLNRLLLLCGAGMTLFLVWFSVGTYRDSHTIADETLFGLAHSLHAAIENSVLHDPSLRTLATFHTPDIAYFALVDRNGVYRFHSNPDLIGTRLRDRATLQRLFAEEMWSGRVRLATGEEAYELITHLHLPAETLGLRIVLHTHRADAVIRQARFNMLALFSLMACGWFLAAVIYRYARREARHQEEMAKRENLARMGEMGAMLAHEIRNPLAGIKGFAQLIEKRPDDPRTGEAAQRIVAEARRLEALVTDLLDFAGSGTAPMTPLDLGAVIEHTAELVRQEAGHSSVALVSDCAGSLRVTGNRDRLAQVLLNIARNGLQAMPDGGTLRIAARPAGSDVVIEVSDTGHGIRPEDLPRVFEPFFTTKARGSGLGLALCRKIVEEHAGTIDITSGEGGTVVRLSFPRSH
ncbi:MAG TPA: ATP-binding protein [Desulfuromonadaceae bacterium]